MLDNFESGTANAAWSQNVVDSSTPGAFTKFLGRFSNGGDTLNLSGLTAGQTYTLKFDLYAIDSLDGQGVTLDGSGNIIPAQYGPDEMNVTIDGTQKLSLAMAYSTTEVQNFNGSATLPLQIVPTLSSMDGSPSGDGTFDLLRLRLPGRRDDGHRRRHHAAELAIHQPVSEPHSGWQQRDRTGSWRR